MNKRINFEDSIFIVMMRLRMIRDVITLDADPELFLEKILDDIYFTDDVLRTLMGYLEENSRLTKRDELMEHLSEAELQFSRCIDGILNNKGNLTVREIASIGEKLIFLQNDSIERRKAIEELTSGPVNRDDDPADGSKVSSEELSELLKAF